MTTLTMTGWRPAQWRALNRLFHLSIAGAVRYPTPLLMKEQAISWDQLAGVWDAEMVDLRVGDTVAPAGSLKTGAGTTVRLSGRGKAHVLGSPANNVICMLGGRSGRTARVRDLKREGEATDELLFTMGEAGLIEAYPDCCGPLPLSAFRHLPPDLQIHLTGLGRTYCPR